MMLRVTRREGRAVARFARPVQLTEESVEEVSRAFAALASGHLPPHLTLDLGEVVFLSTMALGQFVVLDRQARAAGGSLVLRNLRPEVRRVFAATRLDRILAIDAPAGAPA